MSDAPDSSKTVHLLVLIHGMWGNPRHLSELQRIMTQKRCQADSEKGPAGESVHILVAETNRDDGTYDGIDWGGERVAEEILEEVKKLEKEGRRVTRLSVTGYSLGGLIGRYVVGILHQRGFFETVTPVNFNTIATPHIGLPRYPTVFSSLLSYLGPRLLSRTGEQFYVVDKWSQSGRPLLEVMADPNRLFYQALTLFQHVRIYANAVKDRTVPYVTAAIETDDIFADYEASGLHIELDEQYSPIIKSYSLPSEALPQPRKPRPLSPQWFKNLKNNRPILPPFLQFRFPINVLVYAAIPFLIPVILTMVITRFALATRASRSRIKLLEKDESYTQRLVHIVGRLEREMESVAVDMFDDPGMSESDTPAPSLYPAHQDKPQEAGSKTKVRSSAAANETETKGAKKPQVMLSDAQRRIVVWLNSLPGLKKELAFIHRVVNSHAMIISRDAERWAARREGEGVIRHWADHFIV